MHIVDQLKIISLDTKYFLTDIHQYTIFCVPVMKY